MTSLYLQRRRKHHTARWLVALAVMAVVGWVGGLALFAQSLPTHVADEAVLTDAIVVLTGGERRLDEGFRLLAEQRGQRLFISGVYKGVDVQQLIELSATGKSDLTCCIDIGRAASDTAGNADETAAWMQRWNYRSLRLVTAAYHMTRSLMEFHHAMPDVTIIAHPVFSDSVRLERWWAWPGTLRLVTAEYSKFLIAWVRQRLPLHHKEPS